MSIKPLPAPRGGSWKNKGNKTKEEKKEKITSFRARTHLRALGTVHTVAGTLTTPGTPLATLPSLPKFNLQGHGDTSSTVPARPWLSNGGDSCDGRKQVGCPAPPHPNPSFSLSSLICRCRESEQRKTWGRRDNRSWVAQDAEKRALQRAQRRCQHHLLTPQQRHQG